MKSLILIGRRILMSVVFFCLMSTILAQTSDEIKQAIVDPDKERPVIENLINQYSKYLLEKDSVSIAEMYASDGMMGCKKGPEILSSAGSWIRNGIKNDSRHVTFNTVTLTADNELLIETGTAEGRSDMGELKYTFRYLVVWKKEEDTWKLYRDVGL